MFVSRLSTVFCRALLTKPYPIAHIKHTTHPCIIATLPTQFSTRSPDDGDDGKPEQKISSDVDRHLQLIKLEMHQFRESGRKVPDPEFLNKYQWEELLSKETVSARRRYYSFLFGLEKIKETERIRKETKTQAFLEEKERRKLRPPADHIEYRLFKTSFMLRIRPKTMNFWRNNRLTRAMQFGDKLIFDCSYDAHMTPREAASAAKQLEMCFANNRLHKNPFDIHFCNANFNSNTMKYLERCIPTMRDNGFPLNVHEESYLDLFPKEQLVYLTPHCKNDLVEYDPHSIYIVGAMVDKMNKEPLSSAKAKELGLRMARLPLDRYLKWSGGSGKSLTLDQMMLIMLDIKATRNWGYALRHVPRRKIANKVEPSIRKWTAKKKP